MLLLFYNYFCTNDDLDNRCNSYKKAIFCPHPGHACVC